jgi:hypothetical protein
MSPVVDVDSDAGINLAEESKRQSGIKFPKASSQPILLFELCTRLRHDQDMMIPQRLPELFLHRLSYLISEIEPINACPDSRGQLGSGDAGVSHDLAPDPFSMQLKNSLQQRQPGARPGQPNPARNCCQAVWL